jgi:hypothetical protein
MKQYWGLLNTIAQEYNIQKGLHETEGSWKSRIIYSLLGQTGYASLWDIQEEQGSISRSSIQHFKRRVEDVLNSYLSMYPEIAANFPQKPDILSEEIYNIMLSAGCFYHEPNRITAPIRRETAGENCVFVRGQAISEKRLISGIGSYLPMGTTCSLVNGSLSEMFQLNEEYIDNIWKRITSEVYWETYMASIQMSFLRTDPPFYDGYWEDSPKHSRDISLARMGFPGRYIYYLYKTKGQTQLLSQLPIWMTEDGNYQNIAISCLANRGTLPPTTYCIDGEIVEIKIGYVFPPAEMNFIKLYSWPVTFIELNNDFHRIMSLAVFCEMKKIFEAIGYQFMEE